MRKSFTLVELLIVVTIISVLTGAAMPYVNEYLESARTAKAASDLDEIARAIMAYEAQLGVEFDDSTGNVLKGRYLQKIPLDPWGNPYGFASATDANGATVYSSAADLTPGTSDDISVGYKGKLAIVSAKWFDKNGDGLISKGSDAYPASDTLSVRFNRGVTATTANYDNTADNAWSFYRKKTGAAGTNPDIFTQVFAPGGVAGALSLQRSTDGKQITFDLCNASQGSIIMSDSVFKIRDVGKVTDLGGKPSVIASCPIIAK